MPEIAWWYSQAGPTLGYQVWDDELLQLKSGSAVWVRVVATSDQDAEVADAHMNFVASTELEVAKFNQKTGDYEHLLSGAENQEAGRAPGYEVKFSSVERRWLASQTWMGIYLVVVPANVQGEFTLLYGVAAAKEITSKRLLSVGE